MILRLHPLQKVNLLLHISPQATMRLDQAMWRARKARHDPKNQKIKRQRLKKGRANTCAETQGGGKDADSASPSETLAKQGLSGPAKRCAKSSGEFQSTFPRQSLDS